MKKRRISRFNSFTMIMLIISFLVGFCGVGTLFVDKNDYQQTEEVLTLTDNPANVIPEKEPVIDSGNYTVKTWDEKLEEMFDNGQDFDFVGSGSASDPYKISTAEELALVSYLSTHNGVYPYKEILGQKENPETFKAIVTEATSTTEAVYEDLVELEYLDANGMNYIRSGIQECSRIAGKVEVLENASGCFFGYSHASSLTVGFSAKKISIQGKTSVSFSYEHLINQVVDMDINFNNGTYSFGDINGALGELDFTPRSNCVVFGRDFYNYGRPYDITKNFRIYSFKMYDYEDNLVRDFVPCYRVADRVRGFYDKVSQKFIARAENGDGDFNTIKNGAVTSKTLELVSDIYLNDGKLGLNETTDENGSVTYSVAYEDGEDGMLYKWNPMVSSMTLNGKEFKISGMFVNNGKDYAGFYSGVNPTLKEVHLKNALVYGPNNNNVAGFAGKTQGSFTACSFDGYVLGNTYTAGISTWNLWYGAGGYNKCVNYGTIISIGTSASGITYNYTYPHAGGITDSVNYGTIKAGDGAAGISCKGMNMTNCINYGKIYSKGTVYGIGERISKNCINYGEVNGGSSGFGICSYEAKECVNYGKITSAGSRGINGTNATNCINYGEIISSGLACGIASNGNLKNCINYGRIEGKTGAGGIYRPYDGYNYTATLQDCINYGEVYSSDGSAGGISSALYRNMLNIYNCANYGHVQAQNQAGGISHLVTNNGKMCIYNSINQGSVKGGTEVGGIVGANAGSTLQISSCTNVGNVTSTSNAGGFVGLLTGRTTIDSCTNEGQVIGKTATGFIGKETSLCTMKNCLNTGDVESSTFEEAYLKNTFGITTINNIENCITSSKINGEKVNACIYVKDGYFNQNYRTGKITSKNANHNAIFQGVIDSEFIKNNNFIDFTPAPVTDFKSQYTELEYIESTGTQYIDTKYIPKANTKVFVTYKIPQGSSQAIYSSVFGAQNQDNALNSFGLVSYQNKANQYISARVGQNASLVSDVVYETEVEYNVEVSHNKLVINEKTFTSNAKIWDDLQYTMYIFSRNTPGERTITECMTSCRIYSFIIFEGETTIRKFIPVKRNIDGVAGLYDQVNGEFYTNQGTGSFVAGHKKSNVPACYQELEYIESTGAQYIDTGFVFSGEKLRIDFKCSFPQKANENTWNYLFGSQIGSGTTALRNVRFCSWCKNGEQAVSISSGGAGAENAQVMIKPYNNCELEGFYEQNESDKSVYAKINDVVYNGNFINSSKTGKTEKLFGTNESGTNSKAILYYFNIRENGVLIRNFIPAKRNSDGVVGLYETEEGKFYTNQGTGNFVAGAAK